MDYKKMSPREILWDVVGIAQDLAGEAKAACDDMDQGDEPDLADIKMLAGQIALAMRSIENI